MASPVGLTVTEQVVSSSLLGAGQAVVLFFVGHPFDLLKTRAQASHGGGGSGGGGGGVRVSGSGVNAGGGASFQAVYRQGGIRGFYSGGFANFARSVVKESYRGPARGFVKMQYATVIPRHLDRRYPELKNVATSLTMALSDTFILCPLERIKVWFMTSNPGNRSLAAFFRNGPLASNLFRGLRVSFIKSSVSWTSFLVAEEDIRIRVNQYSNRGIREVVPILDQVVIGVLCGLVNCACTLPFDAVKTEFQKSGSSGSQDILQSMKAIYARFGVRGLYSGWQYRMPHYVLGALIASGNIQRIDRLWNVHSHSEET